MLKTNNVVADSWLIIFDNVDNPQILNPFWSDLQQGSMLITSRNPIPRLSALSPWSDTARLAQLSQSEGTQMVITRLREVFSEELDTTFAENLAKKLGCYPLYIDNLASFIEFYPGPLSEFYEQLDSGPGEEEMQGFCGNSPWYTSSVAQVLGEHIARLPQKSKQALATISFFDPDSLPEALLFPNRGEFNGRFDRNSTLYTLWRASLVQSNPIGNEQHHAISLHRLVRDAALRSQVVLQEAFDDAVELLRHAFPLHKRSRDHMVEDWPACETFQPHVLALHQRYQDLKTQHCILPSFDSLELVYSCAWYVFRLPCRQFSLTSGRYLCERGRLKLGEKLIDCVLKDYYRVITVNPDIHSLFFADILTVQLFYRHESTHQRGLKELAEKACAIREAAVNRGILDEFHPNRANGYMNVGVVIAETDPYTAIEMHQKALHIRLGSTAYETEQLHGLALNYLNIGRCWWMVGNLSSAASCFENTLGITKAREAVVGKTFPL